MTKAKMHWWRCVHGAPFDPKWRVVAQAARTEAGKVWAVVSALYDRASQSTDRGSVGSTPLDEIAEGFGWPIEEVQRIYSALKVKSVIIDNRIASWEKHQPKRERAKKDLSAERTRRYRERLKMASQAVTGDVTDVTPVTQNVTPSVTPHVTRCDGPVTVVTHVTQTAPSQTPENPQLFAANGHACDATVTPRDALEKRRTRTIEDTSPLTSSNPDTQNLADSLLVRAEPEPTPRPASKPISSKIQRGTRWPAGQTVPDDWIVEAAKRRAERGLPAIDLVLEAEKFTNYWTAKSGAQATKVDWHAAWRNWSLNAYGVKANGRATQNGQSRSPVFDEAYDAYVAARAEREAARH